MEHGATTTDVAQRDSALRVYLLGTIEFEAALTLQRALVYEVAGERHTGALLLAEHLPLVTVGREGNADHLRWDLNELRARRWPIRWVNRGGGSVLHMPGQLVAYPVLALDHRRLGLRSYVERLQQVVLDLLGDFGIHGRTQPGQAGVWVGDRQIAAVGVAVRDWVSYFGLALNVCPDLMAQRLIRTGAASSSPVTSLERERRGPLRPALVRERFLEHFTARFPFDRTALFFHHPLLNRPAPARNVPVTGLSD